MISAQNNKESYLKLGKMKLILTVQNQIMIKIKDSMLNIIKLNLN